MNDYETGEITTTKAILLPLLLTFKKRGLLHGELSKLSREKC